jgi:hypothetical protein
VASWCCDEGVSIVVSRCKAGFSVHFGARGKTRRHKPTRLTARLFLVTGFNITCYKVDEAVVDVAHNTLIINVKLENECSF